MLCKCIHPTSLTKLGAARSYINYPAIFPNKLSLQIKKNIYVNINVETAIELQHRLVQYDVQVQGSRDIVVRRSYGTRKVVHFRERCEMC